MNFTIHLPPVTKKNHGQIIMCKGRPIMIPSKPYLQYEKDCKVFMPKCEPIGHKVNVQAHYYMSTKRKVDITNLESALLDIMVKHNVLVDDNSTIVVSTDGSRVFYDKNRPRTEVVITNLKMEDEKC